MVVFATGTEIGTGQTHVAQPGTISATTDRNCHRIHTHSLHGIHRPLHNIHMGFDLPAHIIVAIPQGQLHRTLSILGIEECRCGFHSRFLLQEFFHIVVPNDIPQHRLLHFAGHIRQMNKSLVALRTFRALMNRQQTVELHGNELGIDHLILGGTGMNIQATELHFSGCRVEVFKFDLTDGTAVHGISIIRGECRNIEQVCAPADLFIGGKANL